MPRSRRGELALAATATILSGTSPAQGQATGGSFNVGAAVGEQSGQALQLEVFINGRPSGYVVAFTRYADGRFSSPPEQLRTIGLQVPAGTGETEVFLDRIPELSFTYDAAAQVLRILAGVAAQRPTIIDGGRVERSAGPVRPPFGMVLDYTLFGSADDGFGGPRFSGGSGAFGLRTFGRFGLFENTAIAVTSGPRHFTRLSSTYSYEDPRRLLTMRAGDIINGGLAWTRPLRMGGLQIQRSFGIRPDLVTLPVPRLEGSAAAPSSLDLFIDQVKTLSTSVPQGPYAIEHPPIIYGAGQATVVVRDALGRETVTTTAFYASPQLLAKGLTDFSAEIGFARRGYASVSNDYDGRPLLSASTRHGLFDTMTLQGHLEAGAGLLLAGGGGVMTVGDIALVSAAGAVSRSPEGTGGLIDLGLEVRRPGMIVLVRSMRAIGPYTDLATRTASFGPVLTGDRRVFGAPREIDQMSLSLPIRRVSASLGVSLVNSRSATGERFRLMNVSATKDLGRMSFFASVVKDFENSDSFAAFFGLSMALGRTSSASVGGTVADGRVSAYAELSRQGSHEPGSWGWSVRATNDRDRAAHAIVRHSTTFASLEATALYAGDAVFGTLQAEGSLAFIGGGLHASRRLDQSFALVDAGAPGVDVYRENRLVGRTGRSGKLLVPDIAPFEPSTISIDPTGLPVDARVSSTQVQAVAFTRVPLLIKFGVEAGDEALVGLVDPAGVPLPVGSVVARAGLADAVVGYDGQVYLEDVSAQNQLSVVDLDGRRCTAQFRFVPSPGEQVRVPGVICTPVPKEGS